jgi:hypothetical protein
MKKLFLFLLFTSAFLTGFSQYVTLYDDCDFRGRSRTLRPGRYNLDQTGFGSNRLSSIRIPNGLKVVLYDAPEPGKGAKIRMTSDNRCFDSDWNERAQYIVVEADNTGGGDYNNNQYPTQQPVYPAYGSGAQVMIYEDCGLNGNGVNLVPGRYDSRAMGLRNDVISSLRVPKGYNVTVFKEGGFRGESMTFYANVYCLDSRMNDQISSIIVNGPGGDNYNNSPSYNDNNYSSARDKVTIYDQCNYGGQAVPLSPGRYNYNAMGLQNDRISSLRIPRGFRVIAYASKDYQGPSRSFSYDEGCLDGEWNNQISSIVVEGPGGNSGNSGNYDPPPSYSQPGSNTGYAGVTAYVASWFRGEHAVYNEGRHDLRNASVKNNISSLAIQSGYRVTVYEDFGFRGRSQTFTSSVANLQGYGWNDNIRSIIVSRTY